MRSNVSERKRADFTASCARFNAASRCSAISCESDGMPRQRRRRRFIGATRCTSTSNSRAGPSSPANHLSSALIVTVCGSCKRAANNDIAARSRRNPTRIWCTPSGSPLVRAPWLLTIWFKQASPTILNASRVLVPTDNSTGADRHFFFAVDELVAAFRFALDRKSRRVAAFKLELDFAQWQGAFAGLDRAAIQGQFYRMSIGDQRIDGSVHPRLERRPQPAAQLLG